MLLSGFTLAETNSPGVSRLPSLAEVNTEGCGAFSSCSACTWEYDSVDCGYCFTPSPTGPQNGSCVPWTRQEGNLVPVAGQCQAEQGGVERKFVAQYCPTDYSPMIVIGLCLYLVSFQSGLGPVPWIVNAEVFMMD